MCRISVCELVELEATEYSNLQRWVYDRTIFDAVMDGRADAGVIFEPWLGYLLRRHELAPDDIVEVWRTRPYCHCAYTSGPSLSDTDAERFVGMRTLSRAMIRCEPSACLSGSAIQMHGLPSTPEKIWRALQG